MKIVDITNKFELEELEDDINNRNFNGIDLFCTVVHIYKNNKTDTYNAIITVTADTHQFIAKSNYKVYIGHQCCHVYDDLNMQPCYNCGIIGHSGEKCDNESTCLRCAKNHETENCDYTNVIQCTNCLYRKNKFNFNCDVNHIATDSDKCSYLKYHMNKRIRCTDYYVKPKVSRYFGYTGKKTIISTTDQPSIMASNGKTSSDNILPKNKQRDQRNKKDTNKAAAQQTHESSVKKSSKKGNIQEEEEEESSGRTRNQNGQQQTKRKPKVNRNND